VDVRFNDINSLGALITLEPGVSAGFLKIIKFCRLQSKEVVNIYLTDTLTLSSSCDFDNVNAQYFVDAHEGLVTIERSLSTLSFDDRCSLTH